MIDEVWLRLESMGAVSFSTIQTANRPSLAFLTILSWRSTEQVLILQPNSYLNFW